MPKYLAFTIVLAVAVLGAPAAEAQSASNLAALQGLAPVSALQDTAGGKSALAANLAVTASVQDGSAQQPTLLSFAAQQEQALRDAFITAIDAFELADGLGSTLGAAYKSATGHTSADDGKAFAATDLSPAVARVIAYASAVERADSGAAKFFFANATLDGEAPSSANALAILTAIRGTTDIFGKAYNRSAGSIGADRYGNSRPFQTEAHFLTFDGQDFFGVTTRNTAYLQGPSQDLTDSPSFPSGHTTYGYMESLLLALMVPERYPQMVTRAAEYGNDRIILGAHYAMDVVGGRTLAEYDLAQLLANKPGYVGVNRHKLVIEDFRAALADARADLAKALESGCGGTIAACAQRDGGRFADPVKDEAFYEATQTYGLPIVHAQTAAIPEDVGNLAPEAGYLLMAAFPYLTLAQADAILTVTEGPGGGFLDNGSAFGIYSRLDLYRASREAIAGAPAGRAIAP